MKGCMDADEIRRRRPGRTEWPAQQRYKDAADNCHLEVATDEVREGEVHAPNDTTRT